MKTKTAACSEYQAGRCCGRCWCCIPWPKEKTATKRALKRALQSAGATGYDWLSSRGEGKRVDLTEVCG